MKGIKTYNTELKLQNFIINCNDEDLRIIYKGLGSLQLHYILRLDEVEKNTIDYCLIETEFNKVNKCITALNKLKNEKY